jgi:hypothetical protein
MDQRRQTAKLEIPELLTRRANKAVILSVAKDPLINSLTFYREFVTLFHNDVPHSAITTESGIARQNLKIATALQLMPVEGIWS